MGDTGSNPERDQCIQNVKLRGSSFLNKSPLPLKRFLLRVTNAHGPTPQSTACSLLTTAGRNQA